MTALSRLPDVSRLPVIDATPFFDRRWGLERTVKEARKQCRPRGPFRLLVPPNRPGGAYREIRSDGRKYYQVVMSVWDPRSRSKSRSKARLKKATTRKKAAARTKPTPRKKLSKRPPSFLWRDWPPLLGE